MTQPTIPLETSPAPTTPEEGILGKLLVLTYGTLFRPSKTFEELSQGTFPIFIPGMVGGISLFINLTLELSQLGGIDLIQVMMVPVLLGSILFLFLMTAIFHATASFLGGRGKTTTLFTLLCFSQVPCVFAPSVGMVATLPGSLGVVAGICLSLLIPLWTFYLSYLAILKTYRFSSEKAFLTLIMPGILVFLLFAAFLWGAISSLLRP